MKHTNAQTRSQVVDLRRGDVSQVADVLRDERVDVRFQSLSRLRGQREFF